MLDKFKKIFKKDIQKNNSKNNNSNNNSNNRKSDKTNNKKLDKKNKSNINLIEINNKENNQKNIKRDKNNGNRLNKRNYVPKNKTKTQSHILVVDDSDTILKSIHRIFENSNYKVSYTHNGKKALHLINNKKPDIVISDINMPHMTGLELLKYIRNDITLMDLPVILMTDDPYAYILSSQKKGINGLLKKPFSKEDFLNQIAYILQE